LACTSEHFEVFTREPTQNAERIAPVLERAYMWLGTNYAGFVRTTHGGRFRVKCISPFGGAWSSGNVIGLDIYSAHWFAPDRFNEAVDVLYHEFGHCYEGSPPHGALRAPAWGSSIAESQANTLMISCLRACFGERAYHWYRQKMTSQFFRNSPAETFDRQPVIFGYIDQRYGWQVNRDFFRAIYGREGNCKELVESMSFLSTEQERTAAVYSLLARSNLAWLYRWAGYGVTDSTIDRALAYFRDHKAEAPTDSGKAGE
jgi:hypothetical protein